MTKELICIRCPLGCMLTAQVEENKVLSVTGNTCPRGASYAEKELLYPVRTVTSTVRVEQGDIPMVSVKTKEDIPKEKIFACMEAIRGICVQAPVYTGDVVLCDAAGTGVDIVATKTVLESR